jgi:hypothetical protein
MGLIIGSPLFPSVCISVLTSILLLGINVCHHTHFAVMLDLLQPVA